MTAPTSTTESAAMGAKIGAEYEDGQFDDAVEDTTTVVNVTEDQRPLASYIDEEQLLEWSEPENDGDEQDDDLGEDDYEDNRVEDEDWEIAERDFTKQFNRLRQHVAVRTGNAQGVPQSNTKTSGTAQVASLPAVNRPRAQDSSTAARTPVHAHKTTEQLVALSKYASRLAKIGEPYARTTSTTLGQTSTGTGMGVSVNRKGPSAHANMKDKSDRATNEQVLDPRTRLILYKMIGRELLQEINGCVSTGKEANVYHAVAPDRTQLALKIYKTSILIFKDRDRYVTGEHRFRRGYARHNPRKMVRLWAEKEMRNLRRLVTAGVPCPEPIEVRENVLVMTFLGDEEGWASPRLKDAHLSSDAYPPLYRSLILTVRRMFHTCHLVHADLSEYNILIHNNQPHIIDVSQAVEHDHPHAFDFLRSDIKNVEEFFGRYGVKCLGIRKAFEFVTKEEFGEEKGSTEEEVLEKWVEKADDEPEVESGGDGARGLNGSEGHQGETTQPTKSSSAAHEDAVFMQSYIPRTLNEVFDPERDVDALRRGDGQKLIYADTIGVVKPTLNGQNEDGANGEVPKVKRVTFEGDQPPDSGTGEEDDDDDAGSGSGEEEDSDDKKPYSDKKIRGHRHEEREAKKERKKAAREEAREKRKHKMKKAEKKKKINASKH